MGQSFKQMCVSDLIRVDHDGQIVEGQGLLAARPLPSIAIFTAPAPM